MFGRDRDPDELSGCHEPRWRTRRCAGHGLRAADWRPLILPVVETEPLQVVLTWCRGSAGVDSRIGERQEAV